MFELMKGSIVILVNGNEFLLESLKLVLILRVGLHCLRQFLFELVEVCRPSVDIFLGFKEENFLLFVMGFDLLGQCILSILEHLDQHFKLLV